MSAPVVPAAQLDVASGDVEQLEVGVHVARVVQGDRRAAGEAEAAALGAVTATEMRAARGGLDRQRPEARGRRARRAR